MTTRSSPLISALIMAGVIALLPMVFPSNFYYRITTDIYIYALAVVGLVILIGFAGQISLGHAGFAGIGAYAAAVGPGSFGISPFIALILGTIFSGVVAYLVGKPILRLKGHYLAVATLGFGVLVHLILVNESWLTGGPDGIRVARLGLVKWLDDMGFDIHRRVVWYALTGAVLVVGVYLALCLHGSRAGRAMRALRTSEAAAVSVGIDTARYKLAAFVISACYGSVSGALLAMANGFISPEVAGFTRSVEWVAMAVIGGATSVLGALLGAGTLRSLPQIFAGFEDFELMAIGFAMAAVMVFMPRGLWPTISSAWQRARK